VVPVGLEDEVGPLLRAQLSVEVAKPSEAHVGLEILFIYLLFFNRHILML
jgi:hypothetical protein